VEADSGAIGGSGSHEFMVIADSGEAAIVFCPACDYAANVEKAELHPIQAAAAAPLPLAEKHTPGVKTIDAVSAYLAVDPTQTIKTLAYNTDKGMVLALVRGDHEVNEIKLKNEVNCLYLHMAVEADIIQLLRSAAGFIGPVGVPDAIIVADVTVMNMHNAVCGANKPDYHYINVNPGRDFKPAIVADIRLIQADDPCPRCAASVSTARGIEVGQVFKLFTKYSSPLQATYLDESGKEKLIVMGSYGIGVSRTMAAAIEQNHDTDGIIWPASIAPYHVAIVPINVKDGAQMNFAQDIYDRLNNAGVETILDDRDERPGVKFKDADLIGYPLRVTIGPKAVNDNQVEVKVRRGGQVHYFAAGDCASEIKALLAGL
jgi:prolyl-tRNA synthetase